MRRQLLTQVLSFCEEEEEEARGERGGRERRGGGDSRREGGGKNAEVLKGTLTSFLGFPWQPNIPQMNISVRRGREGVEGDGGRDGERWRQRDGAMRAERWRQKDDGAETGRGRGLRPRRRDGDSPPYPTRCRGERRGGAGATRLLPISPWPLGRRCKQQMGEIFWELKGPHSHPPHPFPCPSLLAGPTAWRVLPNHGPSPAPHSPSQTHTQVGMATRTPH